LHGFISPHVTAASGRLSKSHAAMKIQLMCAPHRLCAVGLVAFAIVLVVCSISSCQRSQFSGGLTKLKPCRLPEIKEELLCGKLTVFEDRETRTGRTIDLNIVVFPAFDQKNKGEPLFEIEGGPGAAASNAAMFYAKEGKEYRRKHDVVLVDQRGTGKSNPLIAPPIKKAPQDYLKEMYPVDHVKNLRRTLEQRADLTEYTTPIAMDDLDDVRSWLGYERINLFGLSYGTRAVLAYLRQHPEHVHTATLMGVAPTYLKMPFYHSQAAARAMDLLLQECETDPGCHNAFPQIRVDWQSVLAQLGREPARIQYSPDNKSASDTVEIQRDIFTEKIRNWMYGADKARKIPFIIHQAARGDFVPFLKEAVAPGIPDSIADGMYLSVTCAEDVPFIDQAEAAKLNEGNPFGNYRVFQQTRACSLWPRGKIPADYREPVSSNLPVLIFSGNLDPVTPPQRGEEVAKYLPNSRHVLIPEAGHGMDGLNDAGCVDRIIIDFMDKGSAKDLDTSCVERMRPPPFATN
jgi:pimeloyl-ACP methyl ester carboxylesterase